MSLGVLNNIAAIYAQNNLNKTQNSLQNTLTQLSSGSRINSGADDAAGLAIADGLHANVAALTQSSQNASDGIGLLQTADGALSQVTNLLNRAVTLATEAANGTLNTNQTSSANQEYQNILSEVGNIGATTNFNSSAVFTNSAKRIFVSDGTAGGANSFNNVVGALSTLSVGVTAPVGAPAAVTGTMPSTSGVSTASTSTFTPAGANDTFSGTLSIAVGGGTAHAIAITAGTTGTALAAAINADTTYSGAGVSAAFNSTSGVLSLSGPVGVGNNLSLTGSAVTATPGTTAGVDFTAAGISSLSATTATTVLTSVTTAIADVAYQRGIIGANINQLTAASQVASSESENLTSAESSIRSTNYGTATSDLAKFKVLSSTGISALAQANSVQQEITKLLQ